MKGGALLQGDVDPVPGETSSQATPLREKEAEEHTHPFAHLSAPSGASALWQRCSGRWGDPVKASGTSKVRFCGSPERSRL